MKRIPHDFVPTSISATRSAASISVQFKKDHRIVKTCSCWTLPQKSFEIITTSRAYQCDVELPIGAIWRDIGNIVQILRQIWQKKGRFAAMSDLCEDFRGVLLRCGADLPSSRSALQRSFHLHRCFLVALPVSNPRSSRRHPWRQRGGPIGHGADRNRQGPHAAAFLRFRKEAFYEPSILRARCDRA